MTHPASPARGDLASLRIDRSSPEREGAGRRAVKAGPEVEGSVEILSTSRGARG